MHEILDHEMTQGKFVFYREFHTLEYAREYTSMLDRNHILYRLETSSDLLIDKAIVGQKLMPLYFCRF